MIINIIIILGWGGGCEKNIYQQSDKPFSWILLFMRRSRTCPAYIYKKKIIIINIIIIWGVGVVVKRIFTSNLISLRLELRTSIHLDGKFSEGELACSTGNHPP